MALNKTTVIGENSGETQSLLRHDHNSSSSSSSSSSVSGKTRVQVDIVEATEVTPTKDAEDDQKPTPLPWRPYLVICLLFSITPLTFELIFPFINQMILDVGIVDDPERVGFYSGIIESVFQLMSFIMIMPCSLLSDIYGRKPVILFGVSGLAVSIFLFGFSRQLWVMIVTRSMGGTLGATASTMRIVIAELTDKTNQGPAFSGMVVAYRIGQVLGQPIGGLLAHPERNYPSIPFFQLPFFYEYPFALPGIVSACVAMAGVAAGWVFLPETLAKKVASEHKKGKDKGDTRKSTSGYYGSTETTTTTSTTEIFDIDSETSPESESVPGPSRPSTSRSSTLPVGLGPPSSSANDDSSGAIDRDSTVRLELEEAQTAATKTKKVSIREAFTPDVIQLFASMMMMVLCSETLFALYPLFAFTPISSGGLGLTEAQIGTHMAVRSLIQIPLMFTYEPVKRMLGRVVNPRLGSGSGSNLDMVLYKWTMALWSASVVVLPYLNHLARSRQAQAHDIDIFSLSYTEWDWETVWFYAVLFYFFVVWGVASLAWAGVSILVNEAAPSAEALATVNSISQMCIVLPQGLAPALSTSLFAYSVKEGVLGGELVWVVLTGFGIFAFVHSLTLRASKNDWRDGYRRVVGEAGDL